MAKKSLEHYLEQKVPSQPLFSNQFINNMKKKVTRIEEVVKKFIDKNTITEEEKDYISKHYVIDRKWNTMINIVSKHSEKENLKVLESLITAIKETQTSSELKEDLDVVYAGRAAFLLQKKKIKRARTYIEKLENDLRIVNSKFKKKEEDLGKLQQLPEFKELNKAKDSNTKPATATQTDEDITTLDKELNDLYQEKEKLQQEIKDKQLVIEKTEADLYKKEEQLNKSIQKSNTLNIEMKSLEEDLKQATNDGIEMDQLNKQLSEEMEKHKMDVTAQEEEIVNLRRNQTINIKKGELEDIFKNMEQKIDFLTNAFMKSLEKNDLK